MALLEFLVAAARARVVAANVFQRIAHRLLVAVVAVRAMDMTVVLVVMMVVVVVAVRTMDVGLVHRGVLQN
ncbi:repressor protein c2 [Pseudomonas sp. StFLB209]|nr:repressor protein c2 [Pseudomonas sp. StFLB209]